MTAWSTDGDEEDGGVAWRARLISTLTCLVNLTRLGVSRIGLDTLEWCSALTNLRCLHAGSNKFPSLSSLPTCPQITELQFFMSKALTSLSGLQGCTNLTKLDTCFCRLPSSLEPLRSCSLLTELSLHNCRAISSLEPLSSCPRLTKLNLEGCGAGNLPGLEHLRGLPNLKISGL